MDEHTKLVVVEDDQFLKELLSRHLSQAHINVTYAGTGEEALKAIDEVSPTVVILDIMLPGSMNGFDVLEKMKANPAHKDIPVFILSNLGQKADIDKGMQLGAKDYFVKAHLTPAEITEKIKTVLGGK